MKSKKDQFREVTKKIIPKKGIEEIDLSLISPDGGKFFDLDSIIKEIILKLNKCIQTINNQQERTKSLEKRIDLMEENHTHY